MIKHLTKAGSFLTSQCELKLGKMETDGFLVIQLHLRIYASGDLGDHFTMDGEVQKQLTCRENKTYVQKKVKISFSFWLVLRLNECYNFV